jgi:hypothetical protein
MLESVVVSRLGCGELLPPSCLWWWVVVFLTNVEIKCGGVKLGKFGSVPFQQILLQCEEVECKSNTCMRQRPWTGVL